MTKIANINSNPINKDGVSSSTADGSSIINNLVNEDLAKVSNINNNPLNEDLVQKSKPYDNKIDNKISKDLTN